MPRKARRAFLPPPETGIVRSPSLLLIALLALLLGGGLGSGATYLVMRRASSPRPLAGAGNAQAALTAGNAAYDRRDWTQAIIAYEQVIASGLDTPDIRTDLGSAYRFAGQPDKALAEYQAAQQEAPQHENSLFNQAGVYLDKNDSTRALQIWQQYLTRFPHGSHVADARQLIAQVQAHAPVKSAL